MTSTGSYNTTLSCDALNRLSQVSGSTVTRFQYDGQQIIAEYNSSGVVQRRFVPGPGLDQPLVWFETNATASSNARWLLANAFGSIIAVANSGTSNTTLGINHYDEYGVGPSPDTNIGRFQYKGMPLVPEAGMYYARARFYSQYLGRFMQPDPIGYAGGSNLYSFAQNSPINLSDPLGLTSCDGHEGTSYEYDPGDMDELQVRSHNPYRCPGSPPTFPAEPGVNPTHENHGGGGGGGRSSPQCMAPAADRSFADKVADAIVGFGDAFLIPIVARNLFDISGDVDYGGAAYKGGGYAAYAAGVYRMSYAVAAKGYAAFAAFGAEASALRGAMRWAGAPARDLTKYGSDDALRAAAGRTNPVINALGALTTVGGAYVATRCP